MRRYSSIRKQKLTSWALGLFDCAKVTRVVITGIVLLLCIRSQPDQAVFSLPRGQVGCGIQRPSQLRRGPGHFLKEKVYLGTFSSLAPNRARLIDWQSELGWVKNKGRYRNYVYGFSVTIPKGMLGISSRPPNPQHGIKVTLSEKPESYIWAMANYDATGLGSLDKIASSQLDFLKEKNTEIKEVSRQVILVSRHKAVRLIVEYKDGETGQMMTQDVIFVLKAPPKKGSDTGIIYELELATTQFRYHSDEKLLNRMRKTWRITGLQ